MTSILWIFSTGFSAGGPIRLKLFSAEEGEKRTSHPTDENSPGLVQGLALAMGILHPRHSSYSITLVPSTLQAPQSTAPASQVGSFHQYHTTKGEHLVFQPLACSCTPQHRAHAALCCFAKRRGDRSVHPRHPRGSWTQAQCPPTVPAEPGGNITLKLQQFPAGTGRWLFLEQHLGDAWCGTATYGEARKQLGHWKKPGKNPENCHSWEVSALLSSSG